MNAMSGIDRELFRPFRATEVFAADPQWTNLPVGARPGLNYCGPFRPDSTATSNSPELSPSSFQ